MDVAGIFGIFRRTDRPEHAGEQDFGKAENGVERRSQLVAHIGEELGLGLVGGLGAFFLRLIIGVGDGQFGLLALQLALRGGEIADGRHQPPFLFAQALLMALEKRDVGADRDEAAIAGAPFVDLQPAFVGELHLGGARRPALVRVGDPALDDRPLGGGLDDGALGAGHEDAVGQAVDLLEVAVAHDEAVVLVPQHEGFGRAFDGVGQPLVGLGIALGQTMLLGDVHGDADHMHAAGIGADDLGAGAHPDIMALGVAHAEDLVDLLGLAAANGAGERKQVAIVGMHQPCGIGKGHDLARRREAEHFVHRTRPEQLAVGEVEVPQAAAPARQRRLDAHIAFEEDVVGLAGALHLLEIGVKNDAEDQRNAGEQRDVERHLIAPEGEARP